MSPRPKRCSYISEDGDRCPRPPGVDTDLCRLHEAQEMIQELASHQDVQDALGRLGAAFEGATIGRVARLIDRAAGFVDHLGRPNGQPRPTPQPAPPKAPREDPRVVMGFAPDLKLTPELVKKRRKELARLFHTDKGGSMEAMKRLNIAAEALLQTFKGS